MKEPPGRVRYLTPEESSALLAHLDGELRCIVRVALLTGMRLGEIIKLRGRDVDLSGRILTVAESKNGRARRIPIHADLATLLQPLLRDRDDLLFPSRSGRQRRSDSTSRAFSRAVAMAGIEDFRFHDLRHDFATRLRRQGVGLDVIARLLGHRSLAMTQRYAHIGDEQLAAAVHALVVGQ